MDYISPIVNTLYDITYERLDKASHLEPLRHSDLEIIVDNPALGDFIFTSTYHSEENG